MNMKMNLFIVAACLAIGGTSFYLGTKSSSTTLVEDRTPAAQIDSSSSPSDIGADEKVLNSYIYAVTTKEQVPQMVTQILTYAKEHPESKAALVYASVFETLPLLEGMAYRMRFLVEKIDVAYLLVLGELRTFKRNSDRRAKHIDAIFDFIVDPNPNKTIAGQTGLFTSVTQFQDYMVKQVLPVTAKHAADLKKLAETANPNEPIFRYDANLLFGLDNLISNGPTTRYRKFMPGHLKAMIANMEERMGMGLYLASYNLEKLADFVNTITRNTFTAKKSDFAGGILSTVFSMHIQSPKEIHDEIKSNKYTDFLTLRTEGKGTAGTLHQSWLHMQQAVYYRLLAYNDMEKYDKMPNNNEYFLDPDYLVNRATLNAKILANRYELIKAAGPFTDRLTGQASFTLNVPALFDSEQKGPKDLKYYFANSFVGGKEKDGNDPKTFKWNYEYGRPIGWEDPTFSGLLPDTDNASYRKKINMLSRDNTMPALTMWLRLFMM